MDSKIAKGLAKAQKHLFLCLGPDCCSPKEGQAVWDYLKKRSSELSIPVMRTKANCLRICHGGPWLIVYPEGTWYGEVTIERCEVILREHIEQGKPVTPWITVQNDLQHPPKGV